MSDRYTFAALNCLAAAVWTVNVVNGSYWAVALVAVHFYLAVKYLCD